MLENTDCQRHCPASVEEFRVSVFAPEMPVSEKRLDV